MKSIHCCAVANGLLFVAGAGAQEKKTGKQAFRRTWWRKAAEKADEVVVYSLNGGTEEKDGWHGREGPREDRREGRGREEGTGVRGREGRIGRHQRCPLLPPAPRRTGQVRRHDLRSGDLFRVSLGVSVHRRIRQTVGTRYLRRSRKHSTRFSRMRRSRWPSRRSDPVGVLCRAARTHSTHRHSIRSLAPRRSAQVNDWCAVPLGSASGAYQITSGWWRFHSASVGRCRPS